MVDDVTMPVDAGEEPPVVAAPIQRVPPPDPNVRPLLVTEAVFVPDGLEKLAGSGFWSVELKPNPPKVIQCKTDAEAVRKYMDLMGIRSSVHRFIVAEVDGEGVKADAVVE